MQPWYSLFRFKWRLQWSVATVLSFLLSSFTKWLWFSLMWLNCWSTCNLNYTQIGWCNSWSSSLLQIKKISTHLLVTLVSYTQTHCWLIPSCLTGIAFLQVPSGMYWSLMVQWIRWLWRLWLPRSLVVFINCFHSKLQVTYIANCTCVHALMNSKLYLGRLQLTWGAH